MCKLNINIPRVICGITIDLLASEHMSHQRNDFFRLLFLFILQNVLMTITTIVLTMTGDFFFLILSFHYWLRFI